MGLLSGLKDFLTTAASAVREAAQTAWNTAKVIAAEALLWMADKAEAFIGGVKDLWNRVQPSVAYYLGPMRRILDSLIPDSLLRGLVHIVGAIIDWVIVLENTFLAKKVEEAIHWVLEAVRNFAHWVLSKTDYVVAQAHQVVLRDALGIVKSPERETIELADLINSFLLLQSDLQSMIESSTIEDFEAYLRLRATQKLVRLTKEKLTTFTDIRQMSSDDRFMIKAGEKLISPEPVLTDREVARLDEIIRRQHGTNLLSFVFEEIVISWGAKLDSLKEAQGKAVEILVHKKMERRHLYLEKELTEFSEVQKIALDELDVRTLPALQEEVDSLVKQILQMENYIYASEGLVQMLEKPAAELEAEGHKYRRNEAIRVGKIIIDCAQNDKKWEALTSDEQELLIDYANIYRAQSEARMKRLVSVEVRA